MATESMTHPLPLVVLAGPTASGKTSLAIRLAQEYNGEIICADSRTIYRGMDIGTAKPTREEQAQVPHWGLDLVDPGERFTAADFQQYAQSKIIEIRDRNKIPFLVGGTGLYVDAVVYDFTFPEVTKERSAFEDRSIEELHAHCLDNNIPLPQNFKNRRHLINAILRGSAPQQRRAALIKNSIIVGITTEKETLRKRIELRGAQIFASGVINEAQSLADTYGWESEAMTGNVYPIIRMYLQGVVTLDEAIEHSCIKDWHLAKRQLTWLKRDEHITWLSIDNAYTYIAHHLASVSKI